MKRDLIDITDLTTEEIDFITSILMRWINEHADGAEKLPVTPDLF